ncbi:MAG TPA: carbohydrate-binding family 9-like protein [Bacteroidales bacterium]|nr:carbohydrate-binding family 9-like protein [Bacteroidales bacterium]HPF03406.1 carbohydrate-binding family 9-like protein [Bacteroidales bacterium]HPJ60004.1 carbohydrate-binding family 9-like protein [Bacteroidales bacterium]HPR12927.1 carbohydrate-binding family 9-like protein [Bacteroidales bacterium]HRW86356.1 carbohydrate-binding family 9-like protein [Bacteroidales bacterium]
MKTTEAVLLEFGSAYPDLDSISEKLDTLTRNSVGCINWPGFGYRPDVEFAIAHTAREIVLKYYVSEDYFKAEKTTDNDEVYEDSCVEFFVSPADDGIYYNFEFNGIGTCLMGSGKSRETNMRADASVISGIRRRSSAGTKAVKEIKGRFSWDIVIAIPLSSFTHHKAESSRGLTFKANFYKCGDSLTVPHYLSWNPIHTANPDFHRPEYFGTIKFL